MADLRIAVFVGTRADLGPLESVLRALNQASDIELHVLTGVAFETSELERYLRVDLGVDAQVHGLAPPLAKVDDESVQVHGVVLVAGANELFARIHFDVLIVLGDRWELLFLVPQAYLHRVPIVHLHGGEVTEGALDERVRHAVSKLADGHCTASEDATGRLLRLGEAPERVFHTGAPGLDRVAEASSLKPEELEALVGRTVTRPIGLLTFHPPTLSDIGGLRERAESVFRAALDTLGTVVVTAPGYDAGREEILDAIDSVASEESRLVFVENFGSAFPEVLKSVDLMVGNSSSGIIEAPTAGVASVDVGDRQQGRARSASVIHAEETYDSVARAIAEALTLTSTQLSDYHNPYWVGAAAEQIVSAVREVVDLPRVKEFYDTE